MISKNKLKELAAYRLQKKQDEEGVFVVEGVKLAAEAIAAGAEVLYTCAVTGWQAPEGSVGEMYEVSQTELERLSLMKTPNQVWMVVRRTKPDINSGSTSPLILALDRIQDPGNMGTIMRTADWYGIRRIVCSRDTVSCYNSKVVQASMGAVFRTQVEYVDLPQWLADCGIPVYGASLKGEPLEGKVHGTNVLLIGNESLGISNEAMAAVTRPVLIPNIGGTAESLNAAVAAAILIDRMIAAR